jgi:hypothetical protein
MTSSSRGCNPPNRFPSWASPTLPWIVKPCNDPAWVYTCRPMRALPNHTLSSIVLSLPSAFCR